MHPNEQLVRGEAAAWDAGDVEAIVAYYTAEAEIHVSGTGPLAGDYHGHDGIRDYVGKLSQVLGALEQLDLRVHDVVASDDHVVRLLQVVGRKGERRVEWCHIEIYHVRDGKLDRVWNHMDPQHEVDALMADVAGTLPRNADGG